MSFRFTAHLIESGGDASIGTVGDSYDNALMESAIGLPKTELIKKSGPWETLAEVELGTAEYTDCFNTRSLHGVIGHSARRARGQLFRSHRNRAPCRSRQLKPPPYPD